MSSPPGFPRLYAAASLKQVRRWLIQLGVAGCFPRLYAAASLKQQPAEVVVVQTVLFSAALCRGLIEALSGLMSPGGVRWFSAALCRGLIEARRAGVDEEHPDHVFRGFMPRPH